MIGAGALARMAVHFAASSDARLVGHGRALLEEIRELAELTEDLAQCDAELERTKTALTVAQEDCVDAKAGAQFALAAVGMLRDQLTTAHLTIAKLGAELEAAARELVALRGLRVVR